MKNREIFKLYLFLICLATPCFLSAQEEITNTVVYTSKKCTYSVYKVKAGGTYRCQDYTYVGTVSSIRKVPVSVKKGENFTIFITHGSGEPCGKNKLSTTISVGAFQSKSSLRYEELYDNNCN